MLIKAYDVIPKLKNDKKLGAALQKAILNIVMLLE
jgi:hypothetical protein